MAKAQQSDLVKVHYTGKLKDGTIFDTSDGRDPLEITLGQNQVIPGFEEAIMGMDVGETISTEISCDQA